MRLLRSGSVSLLILTSASCLIVAAAEPSSRQWMHIENVPGGTACAARLDGSEIDTMLMLNQSGRLILVAGNAGWNASGAQEIALRIDGWNVDHLTASAFNNLVMLPITDEAVLKHLKAAKDLYWYLPFGDYHATVTGLGEAFDWVYVCEQRKRMGLSIGP